MLLYKKLITSALVAVMALSLNIRPTFANQTNINFDNLFQNRKLISQTAWKKFSSQSKSHEVPKISVKIYIGPNTKPLYKTPETAIKQVVRAYAQYEPATKVTFIQYQFQDLSWASTQFKKLIDANQMQVFIKNENGALFESHCTASLKNCQGAKALTASTGEAFVLQGVPNELPVSRSDKTRLQTGMLEAHEYFHTLQDVAFRGKNIEQGKYPPMWLTEGSAELVQNLAINQNSLPKYIEFIKNDSMNLYGNYINRDPEYLSEYLDFKNNRNHWENYPNETAYSLGSRICEILVAIQGPNSLIDLNNEMGNGIGFEKAFSNVFGKSWKSVQPVIAKTIAANIKDYL